LCEFVYEKELEDKSKSWQFERDCNWATGRLLELNGNTFLVGSFDTLGSLVVSCLCCFD